MHKNSCMLEKYAILMMYKIEFDSIFNGTCVHCYTGLVNKPMHLTECITPFIDGYIFENSS